MSEPSEPIRVRIAYEDLQGNQHSHEYEVFQSPVSPPLPTTRCDDFVVRPEPGDWSLLAGRADEWFLAHIQLSGPGAAAGLLSPIVFTAGHAVELYLKAVVAAHETLEVAAEFGHKLPTLWERCEAYDHFPFRGLLRPELLDLDRDIYSVQGRARLSSETQRHLSQNELLYLALRHVQDLKYLGAPGRTLRNGLKLTFGSSMPNRVVISQLGRLAHWVWGQWACCPGYNNPSMYEQANALLEAP